MIEVLPLQSLTLTDIEHLVIGYVSNARYEVDKSESSEGMGFRIRKMSLSQPYIKHWELPDEDLLGLYQQLPAQGFSFGAYQHGECVGLALAEPRLWNRSLWIWELHVAEAVRGHGVGGRLLAAVEQKARGNDLRVLVCETQNTNAPAIAFYQKMGFSLHGLDLSYYSNQDYPDGEIAFFMKKPLS